MTCGFEKPVKATATHSHHDMSNMPMHDMAAMDHQSHEKPSHSSHTSFDCCKAMGHCLFGGCSLAAANKDNFFSVQKQTPLAVDFYSRNTPAPLAAPHYRPPIFG